MRRVAATSILAFAASGCAVGPDYERPAVDSQPSYRFGPEKPDPASIADLPWWDLFRDETLRDLVRTALANNYDLRIAISRVDQAAAITGQARSFFFPQVNYSGSIGTGKNALFNAPAVNNGENDVSAAIGVSASWELDLWGRIRRLNEAARAQFLAAEENRRGVMLTLVSDVAQAYFTLLQLDLQLEIFRRATQTFTESAALFRRRFDGGVASKLEVARAEAALGVAAAQIPEFERQIAIQENVINVLLGRNPGPIPRSATLAQQTLPPEVPAGLPSTLLERRPDIRFAEQNIRAANALVGVATANFFPTVSLTGFLGRLSPKINEFSGGSSNSWGIGADLLGPLFTGGALTAQLAQAKAVWDDARLQYNRTILVAFQEVSNALISREKLEGVRFEQERAVLAYTEATQIALKRYSAGKASYYEVLEAQQQLYPVESSLAQTELAQRVTIVLLYKALGGGWALSDEEWSGEPVVAEGGR